MWYLSIFIVFGIVISKDFRAGIGTSIGAAIVFSIVIIFGSIHFVFFTIVRSIKEKNIKTFFKLWYRLIDGVYTSIGDLMKFGFSYKYDEMANVIGGELVEDLIGIKEETAFGEKRITLSAAIGLYEYTGYYLNGFGKGISKALNIAFNQTKHAIGSWIKYRKLKEIDDLNLHGNK